jgi:DNA-binding winged helix-turn-helix (wHTH) protein
MVVRIADCHLDRERRQLTRAGAEVHLSPKAFDLLATLVDARPAAVAKSQLLRRLWPDAVVEEGNLANLIAEIRRALGDSGRDIVRTVARFGYAFAAEVEEAGDRSPARPLVGLRHGETTVLLGAGAYELGRTPSCPLPIAARSVSRLHARLTVDAAGATLEDADSKNGVWLEGERIAGPARLGSEAAFALGRADFRFWRIEEGSTEWASAAPPARAEPRRSGARDPG